MAQRKKSEGKTSHLSILNASDNSNSSNEHLNAPNEIIILINKSVNHQLQSKKQSDYIFLKKNNLYVFNFSLMLLMLLINLIANRCKVNTEGLSYKVSFFTIQAVFLVAIIVKQAYDRIYPEKHDKISGWYARGRGIFHQLSAKKRVEKFYNTDLEAQQLDAPLINKNEKQVFVPITSPTTSSQDPKEEELNYKPILTPFNCRLSD